MLEQELVLVLEQELVLVLEQELVLAEHNLLLKTLPAGSELDPKSLFSVS